MNEMSKKCPGCKPPCPLSRHIILSGSACSLSVKCELYKTSTDLPYKKNKHFISQQKNAQNLSLTGSPSFQDNIKPFKRVHAVIVVVF